MPYSKRKANQQKFPKDLETSREWTRIKRRDIGSVICAYSLSFSFRLGSVIGEKRFKAP